MKNVFTNKSPEPGSSTEDEVPRFKPEKLVSLDGLPAELKMWIIKALLDLITLQRLTSASP